MLRRRALSLRIFSICARRALVAIHRSPVGQTDRSEEDTLVFIREEAGGQSFEQPTSRKIDAPRAKPSARAERRMRSRTPAR